MVNKTLKFIKRLEDGTVKQVNPFTGKEVWTVPERASRPLTNIRPEAPKLIEPRLKEDYCSFCEALEKETTPEKARLVLENGKYKALPYLLPKDSAKFPAEFRRISNLFEIVSYDYWKKNYGHGLSTARKKWKKSYLSDSKGVRHVKDILEYKLRCQGKTEEWLGRNVALHWKDLADSFFGGSNDLIIARKHYSKGACFRNELASSGELSPEEHFQYLKFTLHGVQDVYLNNSHVVYASVFQNWLSQAGASFDHLHKQIVGLDEWGVSLTKIIELVSKRPAVFNEWFLNFCIDEKLVVAENANAVCVASFGEQFPTLAILSKARGFFPWDLNSREVRDFSDLLHACHGALGADAPCNEEWFFTPRNGSAAVPWHVLLKWRLNNPAGFEGNTDIFINTIDPIHLKERIINNLLKLREKNKISEFRIGTECKSEKNSLRYCQASAKGKRRK